MQKDPQTFFHPSSKVTFPFLVLTIPVMAYSSLFPVIPILLLYLMWLPFTYYKRQLSFRPDQTFILPLFFLTLCCLSTLWSDYRGITLYSSIQYASMICIALIISRRTSFETFISGLSLGVFAVLIVTFHTGTFSYAGLFGSKNQVGYFAEIGLLSSSVLFFCGSISRKRKFFLSVVPFLMSLLCLMLSHSASSILTIAIILALCVVAVIITKLPSGIRMFSFFMVALYILALAFAFYVFEFDPVSYVLDIFGKDRTLTGRTDLWDYGFNFAQNNPVLGIGYNAFWVSGRPDAEYLWDIFFIASRTGFHFHNLYIQSLVDLGYLGASMIAAMLILFFKRSLKKVCIEGANIQSIFLLGMSSIFIGRSFVEVDILNPYGLGPLLFYSCYLMVGVGKCHITDIVESNISEKVSQNLPMEK